MTRAVFGHDVLVVLNRAVRSVRADARPVVGTGDVLAALAAESVLPPAPTATYTEPSWNGQAPDPEVTGLLRESANWSKQDAVVVSDGVLAALHAALREEGPGPVRPVWSSDLAHALLGDGHGLRVRPLAVEAPAVRMLRKAGALAGHDHRVQQSLMGWFARGFDFGSAVLFILRSVALREAVRGGRAAVGPADLVLGVLAMDEVMAAYGKSFKPALRPDNDGAALLSASGLDRDALAAAVFAASPAQPGPDGPQTDADAARVLAAARQDAADRGADLVGTTHLVRALAADDAVADLLERHGADTGLLRETARP